MDADNKQELLDAAYSLQNAFIEFNDLIKREKALKQEYDRWKAYGKEVSDEYVSQYDLSKLIEDIENMDTEEAPEDE